jgi:hypothetical protein
LQKANADRKKSIIDGKIHQADGIAEHADL